MCADRIEEVLIIFKFEDEVVVAKGPRRMVVIGAEDEIHCAVVFYASHLAWISLICERADSFRQCDS